MDLKNLLNMMNDERGSDLFITAGRPPSIKIDGVIRPVGTEVLTPEQTMQAAQELMTAKQLKEFEETNECQFAINARGAGRFRVSAFRQRNHAGMVLRRIETRIPTIEELRLPSILRDLGMHKRGIVIFVGGTGTGKSTSLAALIGYRNRMTTGHIITVEDPIEYVHEHDGCIITQREVGVDTESFEIALRNTLRQAPDVILIGEIRTKETMEYAVAFAETGHLVFATLHANNANQALDRIINFFPDEAHRQLFMDLSLNLRAIVAQQLVPHKSGRGRRAVVEILINTPLASDLIRKGEVHKLKEIMAKSSEQGMITFDQALFQLLQEGEISYEEAIRHADSANELRLMVKLKGSEDINRTLADGADKISLVSEEEEVDDSTIFEGVTQAPTGETTATAPGRQRPQQPKEQKLKL
ncbi:MAG: PilT/PilU family type 4a pilus ATPase [Thiohalocapsa sp.]|jgi:twitching motility protein PilU|uniref:PilT/PilU family type 4a pilus ATPase n=1 Tax=Thiohalocapsa sp. TaxID=2497641 RepID=UPI0025DECD5B|nr:PilT/PilU family type 4a pilus ATPase [Thiohalocapsa sp.]MCG6940939.1 PilT/PilU family type 4a pilus ATPase [Thiohalocapsa sp.]